MRHQRRTILLALAAILIAASAGLAAVVKLRSLHDWQYTSDLFLYDRMLAETLRGRFGVEYAYGRQFGEHAYLSLLLLLPAKLALGGRFPELLVVLAPLAYACGAGAFYWGISAGGAGWKAEVSLLFYAFGAALPLGLLEPYCGFHPDIAGAFLGAAMIAVMARAQSSPSRAARGGAVLLLVLFAATKEEFAICALVATAVLALRTRTELSRRWLFIPAAIAAFDAVFLAVMKTPFNRGDLALAQAWLSGGHRFWPPNAEWLVASSLAAGLLVCGAADGLDPYAAAAAAMSAVHFPAAFLLGDYSPLSWHNVPTFVFLSAALAAQFARAGRSAASTAVAATLAAALGARALAWSLPVLAALACAPSGPNFHRTLARRERSAARLRARMNPGFVAAIPLYAAESWARAGARFSFYPHGVSAPPEGIARYAVLDDAQKEVPPPACYRREAADGDFTLYERRGACPGLDAQRERFVRLFGREAIEPASP